MTEEEKHVREPRGGGLKQTGLRILLGADPRMMLPETRLWTHAQYFLASFEVWPFAAIELDREDRRECRCQCEWQVLICLGKI